MGITVLGHPSGKPKLKSAITSRCQFIGRDDTSRANQQVGINTTRHATSEHQVLGCRLAMRQVLGLKRRRAIVALHQTHAVRIASRGHAGEQTCKTIEILGIEHTRGRTTQTQIAPTSPVGNIMSAFMPIERVARHLIRMVARRTQPRACDVHACGLEILIGLKRLVTARHAVKRRALLECERIDRHMVRPPRKHTIKRVLPARHRLSGKPTHKVARHIEPNILHRRDSLKRPFGIMDAANGSQLGIVEGLHAQRDARDTRLGKRGGEPSGQRLRIGFASKLNGLAPHGDTAGKIHQALPCQRRRAAADVDRADLSECPSVAKGIEPRIQVLKIGIERSVQVARRHTARVKVAIAAFLSAKRHVHIQRGNGHS